MTRSRGISVIDSFALETPYATEFRRLLHKIEQTSPGHNSRSILVSSAMLSEGKSTICAFLAITAALHRGLKTLVMDCDLRRPSIHKLFACSRERGLAEVLKDGFRLGDAIKKTSIDKLDLITCGAHHNAPSKLFDVEVIGGLVEQMKFAYDLVLVDAAPILPVSDPMLLAPKIDDIILVVKAGSTQKDVVARAVEILGHSRNQILGVVLNNMNNALPFQYDYRYYGYEYKNRPTQRDQVRVRSPKAPTSQRSPNKPGPSAKDLAKPH
ncbi:MAG: CpsD/CapB family tyrosine-protein kinase [bacterium]